MSNSSTSTLPNWLYKSLAIIAVGLFSTSVSAANLTPSNFWFWQSCQTKASAVGNTGLVVPEGGTECSSNYVAAQQNGGQSATGLSFYGKFTGSSTAPDGSNEIAVFIADDVNGWVGHEMGFLKTLNDNVLKAYLQGGGKYIYATISTGNTGFHTYKAQCQSSDHSKVDYYVDNVYKMTLQNPGQNYWSNWYYFVGTTHRTSGGWSSSGDQVEFYNMTTY